jgi:hypothetical protein
MWKRIEELENKDWMDNLAKEARYASARIPMIDRAKRLANRTNYRECLRNYLVKTHG